MLSYVSRILYEINRPQVNGLIEYEATELRPHIPHLNTTRFGPDMTHLSHQFTITLYEKVCRSWDTTTWVGLGIRKPNGARLDGCQL